MCQTSPAKLLRSVRRMTKFVENKSVMNYLPLLKPRPPLLEFSTPITTEIHPKQINLSLTKTLCISILPANSDKPNPLSVYNPCSVDIPPDPLPCLYCMLVAPKTNLPRTPTSPVPLCCICLKPVDDRFEPLECCGLLLHQHCCGGHLCDWQR